MSDVNANIGIVFDSTQALSSLRQLQAGLSRFNQALTAGNINAANAQKGLNDQLVQAINSTGKFVASQKNVATSTASFTDALEKNKLSMKEYFRYTAAAATANSSASAACNSNKGVAVTQPPAPVVSLPPPPPPPPQQTQTQPQQTHAQDL